MAGKKLPRNEITHRADGVTEIALVPHGEICLINTEKYPIIKDGRWYAHKHKLPSGVELIYARTSLPDPTGKSKTGFRGVLMHKLLTGNPNTDHFNRNGLDNRMENLRPSTKGRNTYNCGKIDMNKVTGNPCTSKHVGVFYQKGKKAGWFGTIGVDGRKVRSLRLSTEEGALQWRIAAEKLYYPDYERHPERLDREKMAAGQE